MNLDCKYFQTGIGIGVPALMLGSGFVAPLTRGSDSLNWKKETLLSKTVRSIVYIKRKTKY